METILDKNKNALLNSFPKELHNDAINVFEILPHNENVFINCYNENYIKNDLIHNNVETVKLNNDIIKIPCRIYFYEPKNIENLNNIQKGIVCCVYSRHHNGFVRQKYIQKMVDNKNYWVTPFFVQLFGEYIYEIMEIFDEYLNINMDNCIKFINENQKYWEKIKNRMISCWHEYYRRKYPEFNKYLGKEILEKINKIINI
ncbi:MAG: hypothetical protein LBK73_01000 [Treponema sp.]|jgi:hypothetical protein|nr:hypothetical protein [Treponema sp.]